MSETLAILGAVILLSGGVLYFSDLKSIMKDRPTWKKIVSEILLIAGTIFVVVGTAMEVIEQYF